MAPRSLRSGAGFKPPRAAVVKSDGGERRGKDGTRFRQVRSRETSASKPSMKCRNSTVDVETGVGGCSGTSKNGDLKTGSCGIRLGGGVNLDRALTRSVGTCRPDVKGASRAGDPCQAAAVFVGVRGHFVAECKTRSSISVSCERASRWFPREMLATHRSRSPRDLPCLSKRA
jgi:hypothetical protein